MSFLRCYIQVQAEISCRNFTFDPDFVSTFECVETDVLRGFVALNVLLLLGMCWSLVYRNAPASVFGGFPVFDFGVRFSVS